MCRQRGTDQRSGSRDTGEVVAEEDPLAHGVIILAVVVGVGGRRALLIQTQYFERDELAVITVADRQYAESKQNNRKSVH